MAAGVIFEPESILIFLDKLEGLITIFAALATVAGQLTVGLLKRVFIDVYFAIIKMITIVIMVVIVVRRGGVVIVLRRGGVVIVVVMMVVVAMIVVMMMAHFFSCGTVRVVFSADKFALFVSMIFMVVMIMIVCRAMLVTIAEVMLV